jgi:two-component system, NarL family, nitrate/nitrite response regulator NarL
MLFGEAVRSALEGVGVSVVGLAVTAEQAVMEVRRTHPDLVLMDIALPDQSGLVAGKRILDEWPDVKILAVTALDDRPVAEEALKRGFRGFLTKDTPVTKFLNSIRAVLDGQLVVPHRLGPAARRATGDEEATLLASQLTIREREVLALLVRGADGRDIATELGISRNTVRTHVQSILTKLQVHSRLEAATYAVRHRLVNMPGTLGLVEAPIRPDRQAGTSP